MPAFSSHGEWLLALILTCAATSFFMTLSFTCRRKAAYDEESGIAHGRLDGLGGGAGGGYVRGCRAADAWHRWHGPCVPGGVCSVWHGAAQPGHTGHRVEGLFGLSLH